jgi:hypothetical protein
VLKALTQGGIWEGIIRGKSYPCNIMHRGCVEPRTSWHKWGDFTTAAPDMSLRKGWRLITDNTGGDLFWTMTHHGWVEPLLGLVTGDGWLMAAVEFSRNMDDTLSY